MWRSGGVGVKAVELVSLMNRWAEPSHTKKTKLQEVPSAVRTGFLNR